MPKELTFDLAVPEETSLTFRLPDQADFIIWLNTEMTFPDIKRFERIAGEFDRLTGAADTTEEIEEDEFNDVVRRLMDICAKKVDYGRFFSFPTFVRLQIINRTGEAVRDMTRDLGLVPDDENEAAQGNDQEPAEETPQPASVNSSPELRAPLAEVSATG